MNTVISRRTILAGTAAIAAAALLAACGGSNATDTPKPQATTAPTVAPTTAPTAAAAATATRPAGSATSASAGTAPPSGTTAATTATGATTAAGTGTTGTTGTTAAGAAATVKPDAFKGKSFSYFQALEYYAAVQAYIKDDMTAFVKAGGGNADIAVQTDQGAQNLQKVQAGVETGSPFDLVHGGNSVQQLVTLNLVTDVSDFVQELIQKYGDVMPIVPKGLQVKGKWYAVPWATTSDAGFCARTSWTRKASSRRA